MGDPARQDEVLAQKASAARRALEARSMSPSKALRRALSRTADVLWDLALVTHGVEQAHLDQDGVVAALGGDALLILLDGPDGVPGVARIERPVMTGLIEVQTILQVTQMPVEERPLTQTDAAMMAPLLDSALERFERYLEDHPLQPQIAGFRFGAMVEDSRTAGLLLDASGYRAFRVSLDLALGRRTGELALFLPDRAEAAAADEAGDLGQEGPHEQKMKLLPVHMDAVLHRLVLPLSAAEKLQPGDLIPLPPEALDGVELLAGDGSGVAGGRLGQINGMRAVRLAWPEGCGLQDPAEGGSTAPPAALSEGAAPAAAEVAAAPAPERGPDLAEDLPELPPMEFDAGTFDTGATDTEEFGGDFGTDFSGEFGSGEDAEESGGAEFDFAAAPFELDED
ncbi:flagellar motor switch protein FliM [Salipiger bermudensis]|uniref:Possible flagellar switch protein FliM n=1 Tax=Salipiger bermudensis (strain DSM 26914 / JCM 13377 / KCTC 12554 / HTCC2601) TaxID=314265 RepID=Q0FKH8_SALBH|nr:flagellar motor switch protein FliM [Salipiger bermudensis]EAU44676.1 possible flagellar switch protein FliM [Salipiger bermudensis HTCC2601]